MTVHWTPQREAHLEQVVDLLKAVVTVFVLVFLLYLAATHGEDQRCERLKQEPARWEQICAEVHR